MLPNVARWELYQLKAGANIESVNVYTFAPLNTASRIEREKVSVQLSHRVHGGIRGKHTKKRETKKLKNAQYQKPIIPPLSNAGKSVNGLHFLACCNPAKMQNRQRRSHILQKKDKKK